MSTVSSPVSQAASHVSWWSKFANPGQSEGKRGQPSDIDTDDFSDHMLRDIGIRDGRATRGDARDQNDWNSLFDNSIKRSL